MMDQNMEKFGCMKRIVTRNPTMDFFPIGEIPATIITAVVHKLKNMDRIKMRRLCKAMNDHMTKIGNTLSSRACKDFSLRFTVENDGFDCQLVEKYLVCNHFKNLEKRSFFKTVNDVEQLVGFSFESIYIVQNKTEDDSPLLKVLGILRRLKLGVNYLSFKNVPEKIVNDFLKVVNCSEIKFEDKTYTLDIVNNLNTKMLRKISFNSLGYASISVLPLLFPFSDINLRFIDTLTGDKLSQNLAEVLFSAPTLGSLSYIKIEVKEDCDISQTDPLDNYSHIKLFSDNFLEDKFIIYGSGSKVQAMRAFPSRIDILYGHSKKLIILIQRDLLTIMTSYKVLEYHILERSEKDEIKELVLSTIAGTTWPLDFSSIGNLLQETEYEDWFDVLTTYAKGLKV